MKKNLLTLLIIFLSVLCGSSKLSAQSSGTWGGIDWTLTPDGTLTITPTKGEPAEDPNTTKWTWEVGQWREAVIYKSNGVALDVGGYPYDVNAVKELIIEEGVTSIGSFTAKFPNLTGEVVIPSTVTYIGQEAFQKVPITKLTFAPGGTNNNLFIAHGAFKAMINIEEIIFPADRPEIDLNAWLFIGCTNLKHVTFPANIINFTGTDNVDYNHKPSAQTGGNAYSFAYWEAKGGVSPCSSLETITFGSEEVKNLYMNSGGNSVGNLPPAGTNVEFNIQGPAVAKVGNTEYETIDEAIANWTNNTTLTLLADVTLSDVITFNSNETNETRTLEFSEHIMNASNGKNALIVSENNTITLQNGTITSNANYVISTSGNLTINNMTINGTVEYLGGDLFTDQPLNIVAKKYFKGLETEGHTQNWSTISTPIANAAIPEATAGIHDLYRFDEPEQEWEYYNDADGQTFKKLELGRGYLYTNSHDITFQLEGNLNAASVSYPLSYTPGNSLKGFNMIGNPFTHTISESNLSTSATLADGFYVVGANGSWTAKADGKIAPMESVLIQADAAENLTIAPSTPNTGSKRAARNENSYLTINVASKTHSDVAYVSFNDGMGLDKINHRNPDNPMLYIPVDGKNYAIAMMNQDVKEVPVHFNANRMAEYTISIEQNNCEFNTMTLVDKLTGIETNMLIEDYTFMARTFDNANRFVIRMSIEDNDDSETENFAFISNGSIVIEKIEGNANIRIFDIMGRHIMGTNATGNANIPVETMSTGMYIIQMSDDNGVKVQKIIIE